MAAKKTTSIRKRSRPSIFALPSFHALCIQAFAFLCVLVACSALQFYSRPLPLVAWIVMQGALAAGLAYWRGMARWWIPIQFFFPLAVALASMLHLPSWIFLGAFLLSVIVYWTTFQTQVPYYPSGPSTWTSVAALLPAERQVNFIDIGSGLGGLVLHLAQKRRDCRFTGIEVAPLPWLVSAARGIFQRSRARFVRGDYRKIDLSEYDVVFAYLSPAAMPALWEKACAEMKSGSLLLSYEFPVPDREPHIVSLPDAKGASLYGWTM